MKLFEKLASKQIFQCVFTQDITCLSKCLTVWCNFPPYPKTVYKVYDVLCKDMKWFLSLSLLLTLDFINETFNISSPMRHILVTRDIKENTYLTFLNYNKMKKTKELDALQNWEENSFGKKVIWPATCNVSRLETNIQAIFGTGHATLSYILKHTQKKLNILIQQWSTRQWKLGTALCKLCCVFCIELFMML